MKGEGGSCESTALIKKIGKTISEIILNRQD